MIKNIHKSIVSLLLFFIITSVSIFFHTTHSRACDVAVISGDYTKSGRPVIWKNRDHGPRWEQEVRHYPAKYDDIGGSVRVIDTASWATWLYPDDIAPDRLSGGVNETGFAITNTTVYEWDPVHEYLSNDNTGLMEKALETCRTVEDFDEILANFRKEPANWNKTISGNFVVIDADGNAVLYEIFSGQGLVAYLIPLKINRFDANDVDDAPYGFVVRTNSHEWIQRNSDTQREERGRDILMDLYEEGEMYPADDSKGLSFENVVLKLSKDVCGDEMPPETPNKFNTYYCISRYMTNLSMVVDGTTSDTPELATLWVTLGEPSAGITTPFFAAANGATPYAWAESAMESAIPVDEKPTCALNQMINDLEIEYLYTNNWDYGSAWVEMDRTIDYEQLQLVQEWSIPLERKIMGNVEAILDTYRNGEESYSGETLYDLSHYAARFAYNNYINRSDSEFPWDFGGVVDDGSNDDTGDTGDSDPDDGTVNTDFSAFITWLLEYFLFL